MRTITPFKQLVTLEIERLQNVVTPRIPAQRLIAGFPAFSDSYTIHQRTLRARGRKGLLARVFGN